MLRLLTLTLVLPLLSAAGQPAKTVWDGVYTREQAGLGRSVYAFSCSRCHGEDLSRSGGVLRGQKFLEDWREDNLQNLFHVIRDTMPRGAPRSLDDADYLAVVAYLLQVNAFPEGTAELAMPELERIRIVGKEGPQPVPDFALVSVVGCLIPGKGGAWLLRDASEPARTRNPREPAAKEIETASATPPGKHSFRLLDTINFPSQLQAGRWLEAKGLLIRAPGDDRINLTWLETIAEACSAGPRPAQR